VRALALSTQGIGAIGFAIVALGIVSLALGTAILILSRRELRDRR
jgi:hypothetical protein